MFKLIVIASFFVFGMTNGAIWRTAGPSVDEKFPDMCYVSEYKMYIPRGGKAPNPKYCEEINCSDGLELTGYSCGVVSYDRKTCVSLGQDLSKPYPDCCEKIKCIGNIDSNVVGN